jgi:phage-related protein
MKPVPFMPWVSVARNGTAVDNSKGRVITPDLTRMGKYPTITLPVFNGTVLKMWLSHLVAVTHLVVPNDVHMRHLVVDYKDGNPENIDADNLFWVVGEYSAKSMKIAAYQVSELMNAYGNSTPTETTVEV